MVKVEGKKGMHKRDGLVKKTRMKGKERKGVGDGEEGIKKKKDKKKWCLDAQKSSMVKGR